MSVADRPVTGRRAGALVPLFSIPTSRSWGIGEIADLPVFGTWLRDAGFSVLQLLPVNEMAHGQSSPYSALSAMAIDPIFISVGDVPEFAAMGGVDTLSAHQQARLAAVRRAPSVQHQAVRALKTEVLESIFEQFFDEQWQPGSPRAEALRKYAQREAWWLDEYALFRALHAERGERPWMEWATPLKDRDPAAIESARGTLQREILYYQWLQWLAAQQWSAARAAAGVAILGDFPFMVSADSADVWARQQEFRVEASVGVPPDAFSETGQDWGLPAYRWDVLEANDYEWLRQRAIRCAALFDGFRVDHLVGFYRTFVREPDGSTAFHPAEEASQKAQGERLLSLFQEHGGTIIAEDLGTVPDFVRASLKDLGVPGLKVMRWEREWETDDQPFRDPAAYPAVSVAISGTHDTETLAEWWGQADEDEREKAAHLPLLREAGIGARDPYSDRVRDALLASLYGAGSDLLLIPVQDIFGWRDRINIPASVSDENWSWRLPWPGDRLPDEPDAVRRADDLRRLARLTRRG
jgi:4-alpha-glucanotransferase